MLNGCLFVDCIARPVPGRGGGAAHLMAHLQDDTRRKLCAAGGWSAKTQTTEDYAGTTIEVTRQ